jgi:hypothetical protein
MKLFKILINLKILKILIKKLKNKFKTNKLMKMILIFIKTMIKLMKTNKINNILIKYNNKKSNYKI